MYDDDDDDNSDPYALSDEVEFIGDELSDEYGPASGGYDAFRGGSAEDDAGEDEEEALRREEARRAAMEESLRRHGAEERQYYDNLAKEADQKRRRMEAEIRAERLKLNELLIRRSRLERERADIDRALADIRANETLLAQKQYRREGLIEEDRAIREAEKMAQKNGEIPHHIVGALGMTPLSPIEAREISEASQNAELVIGALSRNKEDLERRRAEVDSELTALSTTIAERQRALSLKEHTLRRIV